MTTVDAPGEPSLHASSPRESSRSVDAGFVPRGRSALARRLDFRLFVLVFTVLAALLGSASARRVDATTAALTNATLLSLEVAEVRLTGPSSDEDARSFALDVQRQRDLTTHSNALLSDRLPDDPDSPAVDLEVVDVDVDETLGHLTAAWPSAVTLVVFSWEDLSQARREIEVRGDTSRFSIETGLPRGPPSMS